MKELSILVKLVIILVLTFHISGYHVVAQELSKEELEDYSRKKFHSGDYYEAIEGFKKLIYIYPQEEAFNYYLGRCYLHTNQSTEESVKYLQFAASQNYNNEVHYYLAWAYYKNYEFDKAEISIHNFINLARKREIKRLEPYRLKTSITIAREESKMIPVIHVSSIEGIILPQITNIYNQLNGGMFIPKAETFLSNSDIRQDFTGLMYIPSEPKNGTVLYYPGTNKNSKLGTDIYKTTQITGLNYSLPIALKHINSDYNEDYPYYDTKTNTLYFCSDRPGGLGGFDIYMSLFDTISQTFNTPKRLNFPVNSPYDDFLYVLDSSVKQAIFISNRSNKLNEYTVYHIDVSNDISYNFPESIDEIRKYAELPVEKDPMNPEIANKKERPMPQYVDQEYADLKLQQALHYQLKCDSLQNLILESKAELRKETDENNRKALFSVIANAQREIKTNQSKADILFSESKILKEVDQHLRNANVIKRDEPNFQKNAEYIKKDKEVEGITLYNYKSDNKKPTLTNSSPVHIEEKKEFPGSFSILSKSPYSEQNPIPKDYRMPEGLIYRIQLGAFSQNLPVDAFGGLTPLMAEEITSRKITKYYVGVFKSSKEARNALEQVKTIGYNDAFIVPYYNQKKISIQAARELEFGKKK